MNETTGSKLIALRSRSGLTLREIAEMAGYSGPSSVQSYFSAEYVKPLPSAVAARLASALIDRGDPPIQVDDLFSLIGVDLDAVKLPERWAEKWAKSGSAPGEIIPKQTPFDQSSLAEALPHRGQPQGVPAYASALAGDFTFDTYEGDPQPVEMTVFQMDDVIAHVSQPPGIANGRAIYVAFVSGSSMEPRYRAGDPVFVDPKRPPAIGDDVVVQLEAYEANGCVTYEANGCPIGLIKRLVRRSATFVDLEQYNPPIRFRVPMESIAQIHRVIPLAECFGI